MHAAEWSRPHEPFLVSRKVIRRDQHFLSVQKRDIHEFTIRGRRTRCMTVELVFALKWRDDHGFLPKDFAVRPIEAQQHARFLLRKSGHHEDPVLPNNWRRVSSSRHFRLPNHIAGGRPMHRHIRLRARPIHPRTAPAWPVLCEQHSREEQQQKQNSHRNPRKMISTPSNRNSIFPPLPQA